MVMNYSTSKVITHFYQHEFGFSLCSIQIKRKKKPKKLEGGGGGGGGCSVCVRINLNCVQFYAKHKRANQKKCLKITV